MAKKNSLGVSKKNLPGLKRVTVEGKRVWEYKGGFYDSLKELDMVTNPHKYVRMNFTPKTQINVIDDGEKSGIQSGIISMDEKPNEEE